MVIPRENYLNALRLRMHNGMIKVVTGIRRSGKSFLIFNIFKNYLIEIGTDKSHIIEIQLDLMNKVAISRARGLQPPKIATFGAENAIFGSYFIWGVLLPKPLATVHKISFSTV